MATEKYKAKRLYFEYSRLVFGGGYSDRDVCIPAVAVYVPSISLLVQTNPNTDVISGPPQIRSVSSVGDNAREEYGRLKSRIGKKGISKPVLVDQEFVEWGLALHKVNNPSKTLVDLLDPITK